MPRASSPVAYRANTIEGASLADLVPRGEEPSLFLLCIIPDSKSNNGKALYPGTKRFSAATGVVTQCVQLGKVAKMGSQPSYPSGVLLKSNLKLGGVNVSLPPTRGFGGIGAVCPTMVLGADVHHASPGSTNPSIWAVVSSMDRSFGTYLTQVPCSAAPSHVALTTCVGCVTRPRTLSTYSERGALRT